MKKLKKTAISCMLAATMAMGVMAPTFAVAAAAQEERTVIKNYVALGDSMTNGYGLDEFKIDANYRWDPNNGYGWGAMVQGSYPYQVEKMLEEKHKTWDVQVDQLAINAMRPEDLQFLLEYDYVTSTPGVKPDDATTQRYFYGNQERLNFISEIYQTSVQKADFISVNLGSNNYFNFLMNNVLAVVGGDELEYKFDLADQLFGCTPILENFAKNLYNKTRSMLLQIIGSSNESTIKIVEDIVGSLIYTSVGLVKSYEASIDDILDMSKRNVELTLIGVTNIFDGVVATFSGIKIPFGEVIGFVIDEINSYMASVALECNNTKLFRKNKHYNVSFISRFEDANGVKKGYVESFIDAMPQGTTDSIRADLLEDVASSIWSVLEDAIPESLRGLYDKNLSKLANYKAHLDADNNLVDLTGKEGFTLAIYQAFEEALKLVSVGDKVYELDNLVDILGEKLNVAEEMGGVNGIFDGIDPENPDYSVMIAPLAKKIANTPALKCMLFVYSNFLFAGSKGIHPTVAGHKAYATSIVSAIEKADMEYTAVGYFNLQFVSKIVNIVKSVFNFIFSIFRIF